MGRIKVQIGLHKKQDPVSKITKAKRAEGVALGIERLPHKLGLSLEMMCVCVRPI
jgi:hypothetical protein